MDYLSYSKHCEKVHTDISNYYCVQNRGACENCFDKIRKKKIRRPKEKDMFAKYRPKMWNKIHVDNSKTKGAQNDMM